MDPQNQQTPEFKAVESAVDDYSKAAKQALGNLSVCLTEKVQTLQNDQSSTLTEKERAELIKKRRDACIDEYRKVTDHHEKNVKKAEEDYVRATDPKRKK